MLKYEMKKLFLKNKVIFFLPFLVLFGILITAGLYSKNTEYVLPKGHTGFAELEEAEKNWQMSVDIFENFYARPFEVEKGKEGYVFCLTEVKKK